MLLLAAAADAKVRAARRLALGAVIKAAFYLPARILTFLFRQGDLCALVGQQTRNKKGFTIMARHPLTEGIEVCHINSYDLTRRHAPLCRVELRHYQVFSQMNILTLIVP